MYTKYFGFQRAPFELVPDPDFLFLGESHDSALANLVSGLWAGKGFVVITGPIGAGKTTILRALLRRMRRSDRICFLSQPEMNVEDLLRAILDGFGLRPEGEAVVDLRRQVRAFLQAGTEAGVLIVDEAHLLSEEAMEQLRLLSNLEEDRRKLLQIVLSGQPELKQLLARPRLRPLAQRIEMFYDITSLSSEETSAYIDRRLRIAGGPEGVRFEPAAVEMIHRCSDGVPRLINLLADRALVAAYVADTGCITADLVREAYDDLGEVTHAVMPGSPGSTRRRRGAASAGGRASVRRNDPPGGDSTPRRAAVLPMPPRLDDALPSPSGGPRRWTAGAGLVAVVALALLSLGSRHLSAPVTGTAAEVPAVWNGGAPEAASRSFPESGSVTTPEAAPSGAPAIGGPKSAAAADPGRERATAGSVRYAVHVASFRETSRAMDLVETLSGRLLVSASVVPADLQTGRWYRVLVGDFRTREEAETLSRTLEQQEDFAFLRTVAIPAGTGTFRSSAEGSS